MFDPDPAALTAVESSLRAMGMRLAGSTVVAREAIDLVAKTDPDLFVVSVAAGAENEAAALIRTVHDQAGPTIVALGDDRDRATVSATLAAGAIAFLRRFR